MRFCKVLLWILFVLYIGWMLYLLLFQRIGWNADTSYSQWIQQSINLVPFRTIREFIRMVRAHTASGSTDYALAMRNLGGNVVLFVPLGVFLPLLFHRQRHFRTFLLSVTSGIVLVEMIQLFCMLGSCDNDDLICNIYGAACGFGIWRFAAIIRNRRIHQTASSS